MDGKVGRSLVKRLPRPHIPISEPQIGAEEARLVAQAVHGGWVSSRGPFVDRFEGRFARWIGSRHAIATTSGTTALHLALAALGIGPGDEVLVPDYTMVACANAVLYTGARPVFADVDPEHWTLTAESVAEKLHPRTRAILPVHLYGHPAPMDELLAIARERDLAVVEDAAEAHGATYRGTRVGGIGTIGCFSFYSNKLITTGEGGAVVTRSSRLARRARALRDLAFAHAVRDYRHSELGYNYRMTNLQAALGLAQLRQVRRFIHHRREAARLYSDLLSNANGIRLPKEASWARGVYWMYTVRIEGGTRRRARVMRALARRGIETRVGFWPLHRQPFLRRYARVTDRFPVSDRLGREALSLPSGNGISLTTIERVARTLRNVLREGGGTPR